MKKLITIFSIVLSLTGFGQSLNGYKYVFIPTLRYGTNGIDNYNISGSLQKYFSEKGFIVLTETTKELPKEVKDEPCILLLGQIDPTYTFSGVYTVSLILRNCKLEIVYSEKGIASSWSSQDDYKKATKKSFGKIEKMSWHFDSTKTPHLEFPPVEQTKETEESMKTYLSKNKLDPIEGIYKPFQAGNNIYDYKIGIIKKDNQYKAIIIESDFKQWKPGEVKAIFEPSSVKGLYSVKWYMGNKTPYETFGTMENEALLSIELKDPSTGKISPDKYLKMFPQITGDVTFKKDNSLASGSGFFLTTDGIIGTNAHLINNVTSIEVSVFNDAGSSTYKAKALLVDSKNDVALIKIDDPKFKELTSLPYGVSEKADIGEKVFTIGYPLEDIMGTNYKVNDGIISSKSGMEDDIRYYQISVPLQPGNSGGPLFDQSGNIIGITSSGLIGRSITNRVENVNYAVKSSYLISLYNMLPDVKPIPSSSALGNKELQEQVKVLKNYICLIKVY